MFENVNGASLLPFIILFPFIGAIANGLFGKTANRTLVGFTAVGSVVASFVFALVAFIKLHEVKETGGEALTTTLWEWFSISVPNGSGGYRSVPIEITFVFDSLSGLMTLVVTGIGSLIHIYSLGYMSEEKSYSRFFTYLNLFMASMLILVLASSFPVMFVGWEGVGLCSYLLIGFWYENKSYAAAGRKAFIVNRIGDFGILIGMFICVLYAGSFEFSQINAAAPEMTGDFALGGFPIGMTATVACLFLFLGCAGKSAQLPLFVWLPDAMAGPTPVSALIHAATMVTAGVYLCCRLSPVFLESPTALSVIAIVGTCTALLAASVAVVQKEMKRILAYSTVSQLGFMFAAVGVGAFSAGFFHVFTHAFFKACLFLGAGSVMHAVHAHGDANIFKLGGLKKIMPFTHATFLISCVAISGFPLTAGFFSKDEILLGATTVAMNETGIPQWVGWFVAIGLFLAATMTAFYMMRLYYFTFTGSYRSAASEGGDDEHHDENADHDHGYSVTPHESDRSMVFPLVVLSLGAALAGFLAMPHAFHLPNWWGHWMEASIAHLPGFGPSDEVTNMVPVYIAMGLGVGAMAIGMLSARVAFKDKAEDTTTTKIPKKLYSFLMDKWRVDEFYDSVLIKPIRGLAVFQGRIDKSFIDGLLTGATAFIVKSLGWLSTRIQVGVVHAYGTAMVVGFAFVAWWFMYPHASIEADTEGTNATFIAARGLGYEYRWDLDSDGEFDLPAQPSNVTIDLRDDATDEEIRSVITQVRTAIAPAEILPQDRSALGHLYDRGHKIYIMSPPASENADLRLALESTEVVESFRFEATGTAYSSDTNAAVAYDDGDIVGYRLFTGVLRGQPLEFDLSDAAVILEDDVLGPRWQADPDGEGEFADVPPSFRVVDGEVRCRPNGANVIFRGQPMSEEFTMVAGETANVGPVPVRLAAVMATTVEVRNSFGNLDTQRIEVVIDNLPTAINPHVAVAPTQQNAAEAGQ
ncbi:MAG: NADH-quinone oxidoreductase subunit L [Polyangiales bacterium]|jgi:NADH-quinone oxidoreductase subunit L